MLKFILMLFVYCFSSFGFSASVEWVATGPINFNIACVILCFYPGVDDSSYLRGNGLCLWAHSSLSEEDAGKVWTLLIKDSSDKIVHQDLLKIIYDEFCLSGNDPNIFPNGYAVYYYS